MSKTAQKMSPFADVRCARCGVVKAREQFSRDSRYKSGCQSYCRSCAAAYRVENKDRIEAQIRLAKERNPDKYRDQDLQRKYGISLEKYNLLLAEQEGGCACCGATTELNLSVDHDHSCCPGKRSCGQCVRGLLCSNCNFGLGSLKDSPTLLRKAADYIERYTR